MRGANGLSTAIAWLFLAGVTLMMLRQVGGWADYSHPWMLGDWLTSYVGGFQRRGLFGSLAAWVSDTAGVPIVAVVSVLQALFYVAVAACAASLLAGRRLSIWFWLLLVSPASFLFPVLDWEGGGRKEIVHFTLLAAWVLYLRRRSPPGWIAIGVVAGLGVLATLAHELFFFVSPFYAAALAFRAARDGLPLDWRKAAVVPAASLAAFAGVNLLGAEHHAAICADLLARGLPATICEGALDWPTGFSENLALVATRIAEARYLDFYPALLLLAFLPVLGYALHGAPEVQLKSPLRTWTLICLACFLPLYVLALDWGRWTYIFMVSYVLLNAGELRRETAELRLRGAFLLSAAVAVAYMATWNIPHCCESGSGRSLIWAALGGDP